MPDSNNTLTPAKASRQWLIGLVLLVVIAAMVWFFWPAKPENVGNQRFGDMGPVPVRVAEVEAADFPIELKALGTVTAYNTVNVRGRVDGELMKLMFTDGQRVKAGDLLAVIDPRPYQVALQQAQGALLENQAQLKNAEIDLARYKGLYAEDSIAKQTLDTQLALVNQYRGTVKSNQAAVAEAKLNLDFTQVRAPISGRLGLRQVDIGNLVSSGDELPLVVITETTPIAVMFTLPEAELPAVLKHYRAGETLLVEAWDRSEKNRLAEGQLETLDNLIDTATGTVKLKARFANADEMLYPNQFVNVRLRVEIRKNVDVIPAAALQFGSNGPFVYIVDKEDKISIRPVEVGPSNGETTLIEKGVSVGERVVLEGTDRLRDGNKVEVLGTGFAPEPESAPVPLATETDGQSKRKA
ncbi:MdtA/MuxA family multidrug efflux RND transporter periplasmic adaptor subunit [Pseudomonas segetis]|uniref:Membrane fusion protein, multidrug efflux system n=1 Tax=Pseudomonas segetis TaxID=298908 RepID=A0A239ITP5_9PSED|nr:MdtA/MuxA family multidrug efflux RND transporter periplasmic adaptor subunit [Pseudomonas segetis]SNS96915.1 membrane fusion protein, multidrug efflux system [Pseudomonas segetis]